MSNSQRKGKKEEKRKAKNGVDLAAYIPICLSRSTVLYCIDT